MLCSMCCHGTTKTWDCTCGEKHCMHVWRCGGCRNHRYQCRVDTRLGHHRAEGDLGTITAMTPSNDMQEIIRWLGLFNERRRMFFYPDAGKDRTLVLPEKRLRMSHEEWWSTEHSLEKQRQEHIPSFDRVPRGFIYDYMIYWYIGETFQPCERDAVINGSLELAEALKLPDQVPVFNGMNHREPGQPMVPLSTAGILSKKPGTDYIFVAESGAKFHKRKLADGD